MRRFGQGMVLHVAIECNKTLNSNVKNRESFNLHKMQHCVKSVQIRWFFWSVFSRIRTRKISYLDTFHAVQFIKNKQNYFLYSWLIKVVISQHRKWSFPLRISSVNVIKSAWLIKVVISVYKKWIFSLRISSANVIKPAVSCGFGHISWRNPKLKSSYFA